MTWVIPPWPLFGALAVVALAFSTSALAVRKPALHLASTVSALLIIAAWRATTQSNAEVGVIAFSVVALYALVWIPLMKVSADTAAFVTPAATAAVVLVLIEFNLMAMSGDPFPPRFAVTLAAEVVGYVILLALAARYEWPNFAPAIAIVAALTAGMILTVADHTGRQSLIHVAASYAKEQVRLA